MNCLLFTFVFVVYLTVSAILKYIYIVVHVSVDNPQYDGKVICKRGGLELGTLAPDEQVIDDNIMLL